MRECDRHPPPALYAAVLWLRRRGHRVLRYDDGRAVLDGEIVVMSWLRDMAIAEGFVS